MKTMKMGHLRLPLVHDLRMFTGSQWFVASRAMVEYLAPAAAVFWPLSLAKKFPTATEAAKTTESFAVK